MTTNPTVKQTKEFLTIQEIENFLIKLPPVADNEQGVTIPMESYRSLGYAATDILKVLKTAILTERDYPELTKHDKYDAYNLLHVTQNLIPELEMELLDRLNKS